MKEIYTDLQNKYGKNLEDAPVDFSIEDHLKKVSEKLEKLRFGDKKDLAPFGVCLIDFDNKLTGNSKLK